MLFTYVFAASLNEKKKLDNVMKPLKFNQVMLFYDPPSIIIEVRRWCFFVCLRYITDAEVCVILAIILNIGKL